MSVEALVREALDGAGPLWFQGLAAPLAHSRWLAIAEATDLAPTSYGTMRYLLRDVSVPLEIVTSLKLPAAFESERPLVIEKLRGEVLDRYVQLGLEFHPEGSIDVSILEMRLLEAFERIAQVPSAAAAVGAVLGALHVVRPEGPEYDVSYSDPVLPFSIFVGIDGPAQTYGDLRLAEGILHECMHLQLTLVEEALPLIAGTSERIHSPWQSTMRPIQGILHGLYVFRVIQDFHGALLTAGCASANEEAYLRRRIAVIGDEVRSVGEIARSSDLTDVGRHFASRLLAA